MRTQCGLLILSRSECLHTERYRVGLRCVNRTALCEANVIKILFRCRNGTIDRASPASAD
jgi:hypothetical protein